MRGRRTNRKTDAMAKSLKKMEATLETVLKSISQPGLLSSAGSLSDPTLRHLTGSPHPHHDLTSSGGSEVGGSNSGGTAGHHLGLGMNAHGVPGNHQSPLGIEQEREDRTPDIGIGAVPGVGVGRGGGPGEGRAGGDGRADFRNESLGWDRRRAGANGARTSEERNMHQEPRLHSLPDNVLNPLGLLAEWVISLLCIR
ncbi:hypothetical protein P7C70_g6709, partial [Phenoliferia sp. Uapishka_3]